MTRALTRRKHHIGTQQIMLIAAAAGIVSALLPSIPTVVRFWEDETEVTVFGRKMKYSEFLRWWVGLSAVGLGVIWSEFRRR